MDLGSRGMFGRLSGLHGLTDFSLRQLIAWGDHLKVDQAQIDAQHEAIFNPCLSGCHTQSLDVVGRDFLA